MTPDIREKARDLLLGDSLQDIPAMLRYIKEQAAEIARLRAQAAGQGEPIP